MGIAADFPHAETGDQDQEFSDWDLRGVNDENSSRGRLYVESSATTVELYRDRAKAAGDLMAVATAGAGVTAVFVPQNNSLLSGSVYRSGGHVTSAVVIYAGLCSEQDLREFDDRLDGMLLEGEVDFGFPIREATRQFLIMFASIYPPPPGISSPLRFVADLLEPGRKGSPEWSSQYYWSLTRSGVWELTGLQNVSDYRSWAIYKTLAIIYERKARAGDASDPVFSRAVWFAGKAEALFYSTRPWVDVDGDNLPDRQTKTRSPRIRRG